MAVDHLFALSMPAFVSAPFKKSFSRVSWPTFAWSVLTSIGESSGFEDFANTSVALCSNWFFHWVIWLGWRSNRWASSVRVYFFWAASNVSFALKAAVWFLLDLLFIVLLVFGRQIMPHVGAGNPLIRLCRFVGSPLNRYSMLRSGIKMSIQDQERSFLFVSAFEALTSANRSS